MTMSAIVGFAAAACTTFALVPQVVRAWSTRSTNDVSMGWLLVLAVGTFLWFVYGLMNRDIPLIAANGFTLVLTLIILGLKLRHG